MKEETNGANVEDDRVASTKSCDLERITSESQQVLVARSLAGELQTAMKNLRHVSLAQSMETLGDLLLGKNSQSETSETVEEERNRLLQGVNG